MAQSHLFVAFDLLVDMLWMALNIRATWCGLKGMGNPIFFWIPPQLTLNNEFFRPLGMEHFYDAFALESEISVRREALHLFGLRADELLPDLHITRDGVLRIELGAHQEHRVNHVARATDRTEVSADVIQLAAHEVDTAPVQAVSDGEASNSEGSESVSDSDQNDLPSFPVADAEQCELMQIAYAAVGKDFTGQEDLIGSEYEKPQKLEMVSERWPLARLSFSLQTCVDHLDRAGNPYNSL